MLTLQLWKWFLPLLLEICLKSCTLEMEENVLWLCCWTEKDHRRETLDPGPVYYTYPLSLAKYPQLVEPQFFYLQKFIIAHRFLEGFICASQSVDQQYPYYLRTKSLDPTPDLLGQKDRGWNPEVFYKPSRWFWCTPKFENHWSKIIPLIEDWWGQGHVTNSVRQSLLYVLSIHTPFSL